MKTNLFKSIPVILALTWILLKLVLYTFEFPSQEKIGVFINLFLLLFAGIIPLHQKVAKEKKLETYGVNFKFVLKNMGIYIIMVSLYTFIHFKFINPGYLQAKEEARMEEIYKQDFDKIKKNNPQWETKEDYIKQAEGSAKVLSSVSLNVSFYFLFLFIMSLFYGIFVPIFYKKVVLRM